MTNSNTLKNPKKFDNNLSISTKSGKTGLWGQEDLNISDTIDFLKKSGFSDVTHKMLRDLDDIILPKKKASSNYRSFNFDILNKTKIILTLRAFGFSKKKIAYLLSLREAISDLANNGVSPDDLDKLELKVMSKHDANILHNKVLEYRTILSEIRVRADELNKIINIGLDFVDNQEEVAKDISD